MRRPPVSFCLVVYDEEEHILDCLRSLVPFMHTPGDEIVLVEQRSTDRTETEIKAFLDRYPFVPIQVHVVEYLGVCERYRQFSLDRARNDYCLVVDADERLRGDLDQVVADAARLGWKLVCFPRHYVVTDCADVNLQSHMGEDPQFRLLDRTVVRWPKQVHATPVYGQATMSRLVTIDHYWRFGDLAAKVTLYESSASDDAERQRLEELHRNAYAGCRRAIAEQLAQRGILHQYALS